MPPSLTREGLDAICTLWVRDMERFAFVIWLGVAKRDMRHAARDMDTCGVVIWLGVAKRDMRHAARDMDTCGVVI